MYARLLVSLPLLHPRSIRYRLDPSYLLLQAAWRSTYLPSYLVKPITDSTILQIQLHEGIDGQALLYVSSFALLEAEIFICAELSPAVLSLLLPKDHMASGTALRRSSLAARTSSSKFGYQWKSMQRFDDFMRVLLLRFDSTRHRASELAA
jgi:hypothetical protein